VIEVTSLSKRFGETLAVDNLSFRVEPARVTGFLGPNGAGKTTTMRSVLSGPQVVIPLRDGQLALGTWQGIFFCEFDGPRTRTVLVTPLQ